MSVRNSDLDHQLTASLIAIYKTGERYLRFYLRWVSGAEITIKHDWRERPFSSKSLTGNSLFTENAIIIVPDPGMQRRGVEYAYDLPDDRDLVAMKLFAQLPR